MNELDTPFGVFAYSAISAACRRQVVEALDEDSFPLQLLASHLRNLIRQLDSAHDAEGKRPRPSDV
jgi:hypothetical protein